METKTISINYKIFFYIFFISLITYGYSLSNFSLSVDNETPIIPDFSIHLGRWGTNVVRYHLFGNLLPYFTLLFSLFFVSASAFVLTKLFKLNFFSSILFGALYVSLPQLAYQMVFLMQSDAIGLGMFFSALAIYLLVEKFIYNNNKFKWLWMLLVALMLMFVIACYQGLILLPVVTFLCYLFSISSTLDFKKFLINIGYFSIALIAGALLYYISIKTVFPITGEGNFGIYTSGDSSNKFSKFMTVLRKNLLGTFYYGDKFYFVILIAAAVLIYSSAVKKIWLNIVLILGVVLLPFIISFPITNDYHPPRIYIACVVSFAFIVTMASEKIKNKNYIVPFAVFIVLSNIFYITNLYVSNHKIYQHDIRLAEQISKAVRDKYPNITPEQIVYFHGGIPYESFGKLVLPDSEIFGGSMFNWDNGNNYRMISFFDYTNIDTFKLLNDLDKYKSIESSIETIPIWPDKNSVQMVNDVIIVRLAKDKGSPLPCEF